MPNIASFHWPNSTFSPPAIKPKKKRLRPDKLKYRASLFPRVIKRDVRRLFPQMVANVWNSSDPALFRAFFETFATSNFSVSGIPEVVLDDINGVVKQPPKDMDGLVSHYEVEQDLMVDVVVHLEESGIKQFLHRSNHSQVIIQYQICGTKLYEYKAAPAAILLPPINPDLAQLTPQCTRRGLLEDPVAVSMRGIITLDMDDQYRINSFHVNILSST